MPTIIIPASHETQPYYERPLDIRKAKRITMSWFWNMQNVGVGEGWVDFWIELKRDVGVREGGWGSQDETWLIYQPGGNPGANGLQYMQGYLNTPEQKNFAKIGGVTVEPGLGGVWIPADGKEYTARGSLTIPGPRYNTEARTFWERRLGGAYGSGYQPAQKFHLTVKLFQLDHAKAYYAGRYAHELGEHRWENLFEVEEW